MKRLIVSVLFLSATQLSAQTIYDNTFGISGGLFFPEMDTVLRVDDGDSDLGTQVSLEDDLRFDSSDQIARFELFWRPAQKHRISMEYYAINRDTSWVLDADLEIGETVYPVGTQVSSNFDTRIIPFIYEYSVYQTADTEVGLGGGFHWIDLEFGIRASGTSLEEFSSVSGPLPLVGFSVDHRFAERWMFRGTLQAFSASVNKIDGTIVSARAGVDYQFTPAFSLGLGYDLFDLDVDLRKNSWKGRVSYDYNGFNLRAALTW